MCNIGCLRIGCFLGGWLKEEKFGFRKLIIGSSYRFDRATTFEMSLWPGETAS